LNYRLIVLLRAIPTGALPFEAFPSAAAGVRVTSAPAFPPLRRRKRLRRPQGLLPQLSPLPAVGVTRPSARGSLGLSCSSSEGSGVPQSPEEPGKPGRQLPAGWNPETARRPSLPECIPGPVPRGGRDRLWSRVTPDRSPRIHFPAGPVTSDREPKSDVVHPRLLLHSSRFRIYVPLDPCGCIENVEFSFFGVRSFRRLPADFPREVRVVSCVRSGPRGVPGPREGLRRR